MSLRMIRQYEQGARDIRKASVSELFALAEVLHCSVEDQEYRTGAVALKCFSVQQPPVIIIVVLLLFSVELCIQVSLAASCHTDQNDQRKEQESNPQFSMI